MVSLDALFANPVDCYLALFQDAVYEHDNQFNYSCDQGVFKRRDRVAVAKTVVDMADTVYAYLGKRNKGLESCKPHIDYVSLLAVLTRYSRDIYGFRRISAKMRDVGSKLDQAQRDELKKIILEGADFGFKILSESPYIERQAAVLLYWFSVLKPFHLDFKVGAVPPETFIQAYFNEYFSYYLICVALHTQSVDFTLHSNKEVFIEFLNQLHFRNLSRSSLDFFLPYAKK
jgi:hypothetical protein